MHGTESQDWYDIYLKLLYTSSKISPCGLVDLGNLSAFNEWRERVCQGNKKLLKRAEYRSLGWVIHERAHALVLVTRQKLMEKIEDEVNPILQVVFSCLRPEAQLFLILPKNSMSGLGPQLNLQTQVPLKNRTYFYYKPHELMSSFGVTIAQQYK